MLELTEEFIDLCSTILGRFHNEIIESIITGFRNQINSLPDCLKVKYERLIPYKNTHSITIQLAIINHFKQRYFSELIVNNNRTIILIEDELTLAYIFLLAKIADQLSKYDLGDLKLLFIISQSVASLFQLYQHSGDKLEQFFRKVLECASLLKYMPVKVKIIIEEFNEFIIRYEDFLTDFAIYYTDIINSFVLTDEISNTKPSIEIRSNEQLTSWNIPKKGLCVIINISEFSRSKSFPARNGSDKDVKIIITAFKKLKFTTLQSNYSFKKDNFDQVLQTINNKKEYEYYDCLVVFIMSHGFLHSFVSGDSKEVVIRNFVKHFSDSSVATIWTGKPRLFFIQACRVPLPPTYNNLFQNNTRTEIKQNDLSPRMIVAYSCSPSEESKRNKDGGSYYIQILCIALLKFGHSMSIQQILEFTANYMGGCNEYLAERKKSSLENQQPEYIEREFNLKFRLSNHCILDNYSSWTTEEQIVFGFSLFIWGQIENLMKKKI